MSTTHAGPQPHVSVVIPAYNEQTRLPATLQAIFEYFRTREYAAEILVVDDGSDDGTAEVAARNQATVVRCEHRGKGAAVRVGALAAAGELVLLCDADLAVPIEEWEKLRAELKDGADVAIGSREGLGASREGEPVHRHLMGRAFNLIVQTVALSGIRDTQCGFKALRRAVARDLFERVLLYTHSAGPIRGAAVTAYDVELLFLARRRGYQVAEVPVKWQYGAASKVSPLRDSVRNITDVLRVRANEWRGLYSESRPLRSYGAELSK